MNIEDLKKKIDVFLKNMDYSLYDIKYKESKKNNILTIFIDSKHGITIDDCVKVTNELNPYLDELDPIPNEYFLEVSSPGAEKELRSSEDVKNAVGKYVYIETYEQKFKGYLEQFDDFEIVLNIKNKKIKINYEEVNLIRLAIKF